MSTRVDYDKAGSLAARKKRDNKMKALARTSVAIWLINCVVVFALKDIYSDIYRLAWPQPIICGSAWIFSAPVVAVISLLIAVQCTNERVGKPGRWNKGVLLGVVSLSAMAGFAYLVICLLFLIG